MARNQSTKLTLTCPEDFSSEERRLLAEKVIDFISERTKMGYNVYGRDWSGEAGRYTEGYAKQKGVSKDGPVDLALSHDMLDSIQYFSGQSGSGEIVVGFKSGTKVERKAEGNILGTYGKAEPNPKKARPFLDILQKDLKDLIDEVLDERDAYVQLGRDLRGMHVLPIRAWNRPFIQRHLPIMLAAFHEASGEKVHRLCDMPFDMDHLFKVRRGSPWLIHSRI